MSSVAWTRRRRAFGRFWAAYRAEKAGMAGLVVLVVAVAMAVTAPLFIDESVTSVVSGTGERLAPPSLDDPLGTDESGRSILLMIWWGARTSLLIGFLAALLSMVIGTVFGISAGHFRGWLGAVLMRITDWFLVLPSLVTALVLAAILGGSTWTIIIAIGVTSWASTARLIRAQTLAVEARPYIERSTALGAGHWHITTRHVLPNVAPLLLASTTLEVASAIVTESTLAFLGRECEQDVLGHDAARVVRLGCGHLRGLVVHPGPGPVHRHGRDGFHALRPGAGEGPEPATAEGGGVSLLELDDVSVTYRIADGDVPAVRGVSLSLAAGEALGVAGESGSGKSTLAMSLLRLLPRDAQVTGRILLDGEDVLAMKWGRLRAVRWAEASIVFQGAQHGLNPVQRIGDQIAEPLLVHGLATPDKARGRVTELLAQVGLPAWRARSYPHELSGGQRQRVMIAMALACSPRLIVADEPTTALDVMVQAQVLTLDPGPGRGAGHRAADDQPRPVGAGRRVRPAGRDVRRPGGRGRARRTTCSTTPRTRTAGRWRRPSRRSATPPPGARRAAWAATRRTRWTCRRGCAFQPRCPVAVDVCATEDVLLRPAGERRTAACVHVGVPAEETTR